MNNHAMDRENIYALWNHVHWLTVLADQGSFTASAKYLNVSKAAMSQRIAELEKVAGVALVQRTTRSVRLTEAGQQLVDTTREAFSQIANSFEGVRELASSPKGTVRMTAPVAFGRQQLIPRLPAFLRQYPDVRIELDLSDQLSALAVEGFDLAIRHTSAPPDTYVALPLCTTQSILAASPGYLNEFGAPTAPEMLAQHVCLHYPRRQSTTTWSFKPRARKTRRVSGNGGPAKVVVPTPVVVPVRGSFAVNNSEGLRAAAIDGLGIALLPDFTAQSALQSGALVRVLPEWRPVGVFGENLFAIRQYSAHVPRAVNVLVAYLRDTFKDGFDV